MSLGQYYFEEKILVFTKEWIPDNPRWLLVSHSMPSQLLLHTISILRIVWVAINITRRSHNMQCYHATRPLFMTQYCRSDLGVAIVNVHNERLFGLLGENPLSFKSLRLVSRLWKSRKRLTSFEMRFGGDFSHNPVWKLHIHGDSAPEPSIPSPCAMSISEDSYGSPSDMIISLGSSLCSCVNSVMHPYLLQGKTKP